ncbi:homocysteine S-methyltransferase family protein [Candidatus Poribacteria bacterium]|nr:homocysteine S-methyltransferase family protein [Candidatus Poribacteria bacterium]MYG07419.1 homocysteine S-methyltransferase family protein [Candidatus Poribacteria bacterium]MYK22268.1 homocysteine S-methyltransferase family protein [Candidatus Poribacteria bacterium]
MQEDPIIKNFQERLKSDKPILYDGGFGSQLFARDIELANSALANELHPAAVIDIHSDYISAGAEAIGTNTFVASPLHLEMAGQDTSDAQRLIRLAVQHAKAAIERNEKEVYIAGSVGPSPGAIEADSGDTTFGIPNADAREAHKLVIHTLAEEGVDFLCLETMFSAKEAALAVDVARETGIPVAVNLTYKWTKERRTGDVIYRTDWGNSPADLLEILMNNEFSGGSSLLDAVSIMGVNCGAESRRDEHTGMPYAISGIQQLNTALAETGINGKWMMAYPNAGMPKLDENHNTVYTQTPAEMASHVPALIEAGAYLIGGCCGTTPKHIKAFREAISSYYSEHDNG